MSAHASRHLSLRSSRGAAASSWLWLLAGGLFAAAATAPRVRTLAAPDRPERATTPDEFLTIASVHELRSLPGIGPARALALARWRWEHEGVLAVDDLEAVPNIGPGTRAAIEAALVVHADRAETAAIQPAR